MRILKGPTTKATKGIVPCYARSWPRPDRRLSFGGIAVRQPPALTYRVNVSMPEEQQATTPQQTKGPQSKEPHAQSKLTWTIPLAFIGVLVALYFAWPAFQASAHEAYAALMSGEQARVEAWVAQFGAWGFAAILALMLLQALLAFIPSVLIMVVAVLAYGPWVGGLLAWGGLLLAASMAHVIGRLLGPVTVERLIGHETEEKIDGFLARYGVWAIIAARISPALSTDAISYAAGLAGMSYARFAAATALGTVPLTVLVAYLGADVQHLESGLLWVSALSLLLFAGYVVYDKRYAQPDA